MGLYALSTMPYIRVITFCIVVLFSVTCRYSPFILWILFRQEHVKLEAAKTADVWRMGRWFLLLWQTLIWLGLCNFTLFL